MNNFKAGDRIRHMLGHTGTVVEVAEDGLLWDGGDLRVAWDDGDDLNTSSRNCELLEPDFGEEYEPIDRVIDGDDPWDIGWTPCDDDCCGPDEPSAEEYAEAVNIFDSPELEAAIDKAIKAETMDPTDLRWLDPRRVAALSAATDSYFAQVRFGYACVPDASHLLSIARFLLDEEFVVGTVNN